MRTIVRVAAEFDYEKTLAREMWRDVVHDAKKLFKIVFDLENDYKQGEPFNLNVKGASFICQAFAAGGDWENPVLYYRIQITKMPPAMTFRSFGTEVYPSKEPFLVFIPSKDQGNNNLQQKDDKQVATHNGCGTGKAEDPDEGKAKKALKDYLDDCLTPVKNATVVVRTSGFEKFASPKMDTLKSNKVKLSDEEREKVMKAKAVWHPGNKDEPVPAVWKSEVRGETWFVTNTHRAYQAEKTLDAAIKAFHNFIKGTA